MKKAITLTNCRIQVNRKRLGNKKRRICVCGLGEALSFRRRSPRIIRTESLLQKSVDSRGVGSYDLNSDRDSKMQFFGIDLKDVANKTRPVKKSNPIHSPSGVAYNGKRSFRRSERARRRKTFDSQPGADRITLSESESGAYPGE